MVHVQWQHMLLYPAGWYVRDIPVVATLQLPANLQPFTSLTSVRGPEHAEGSFTFASETLDRLIDAPVYAAKYAREVELPSPPAAAVHLDLLADAPGDLVVPPVEFAKMSALIVQTAKIFGLAPFR